MVHLAAYWRAVLVVQRDVEDGAHLGLQLQALGHARLDAGVVVADRDVRCCVAFVEEGRARGHGRLLRAGA